MYNHNEEIMKTISCKKDYTLSEKEKTIFSEHLLREGLSNNVWHLFEEWVARSTTAVNFFYLKVMSGDDLIGVGLFLKIKPVDLRTSYSRLRRNAVLNRLAGVFSAVSNNCLYISFRNLITSNLTRPFFYSDPIMADDIMKAMLTYLKNEKEADMVTIIDTLDHDARYRAEGFTAYPSSSEAILDIVKYSGRDEYLAAHRNLKKNLAKKKITVMAEVCRGPVCDEDRRQMKACVRNSVEVSNVNNPCQKFFEEHIFDTEAYRSDDYIHIMVRVEDVIAGFHTFLVSGGSLGGVLGGFNRAFSHNNFAYERVIIASLEYAAAHNLRRINYSLIDNRTKLRFIDTLVPCALYFYARKSLNRKIFSLTYRFNDVHGLAELEKNGKNK